jgi:hypothetical protein
MVTNEANEQIKRDREAKQAEAEAKASEPVAQAVAEAET